MTGRSGMVGANNLGNRGRNTRMGDSILSRLVVLVVTLGAWAGVDDHLAFAGQETPGEVEKLLDQALGRNVKQVRVVIARVIPMLHESKSISPDERDRLASKLARVLKQSVRTPAELRQLMGEKTSWIVGRQIMYRRYREQWLLEGPLRLVAVFEYPQGEEARLLAVRPLPVGH